MKGIIKSLSIDVIKFFIGYAVLAVIVSQITENLPRSWDPTGMGMLAVIVLFLGFVICAFKVGASYSDDLEEQEPSSLLLVLKRPVRSIKYGVISLVFNFLLLFLVMIISDYFLY